MLSEFFGTGISSPFAVIERAMILEFVAFTWKCGYTWLGLSPLKVLN